MKKRFIQNDCLCRDASKTFILLLLSHGLYDVHFFIDGGLDISALLAHDAVQPRTIDEPRDGSSSKH